MVDSLIRIPFVISDETNINITMESLSDGCCVKTIDSDMLPLTYQNIDKDQWKDIEIVVQLRLANYHAKHFRGRIIVKQLIC